MNTQAPKTAKNQGFFSIITVTKDNIAGLKATCESLLKQSTENYEWIVIDGASADGSQDFLKGVKANWVSEPDNGIFDAMNKGIEKASGDWLLFLNAGDTLASSETLAYIEKVTESQTAFIYGDSFENIDKGDVYKPARSAIIARGMFTHHQAMLYRRDAIGDLRYNPDYKIAADYDFTAQFLAQNLKTQYIHIPICVFESGGISQQQSDLGRQEQFQIRENLKLTSPLQNKIITFAQSLIWKLRRLFPNLYWNLKSRHS